ncbi:MAG TPA: hypothetical protein VJ276_24710 [Thermoanaerobaculia bacterium]|nr:hypothetical protein [Thermoanaerobaculia bacterium]
MLTWLLLAFAFILLALLIVSFRARAVVFCQYLRTMTGIELQPPLVRRVFRESGKEGVRELFLDLIIREDLKEGPADPEETLRGREAVN